MTVNMELQSNKEEIIWIRFACHKGDNTTQSCLSHYLNGEREGGGAVSKVTRNEKCEIPGGNLT